MFKIVKDLTPMNYTKKGSTKRIKYIVIHYFGSLGTAEAVARYFRTAYRGASAHYSLDEGTNIYQSVEDGDIAWHCGTSGTYYHRECRNSNSIGIEVRPRKVNTKSLKASDTDWYFTDDVLERLDEFTKYLMKKYNIPAENVLRHYDITRKYCPRPFMGDDINSYHKVSGNEMWKRFKARLSAAPTPEAPSYKVGDIVVFKGGPVYTTANATVSRSHKQQSVCKITAVAKGTHPYHCISTDGKGVYGWVDANLVVPNEYKVRVTATALNYRSGPGTSYKINGTIRDKGIYTIVETKGDWGKLKSGNGWIHLGYTTKL